MGLYSYKRRIMFIAILFVFFNIPFITEANGQLVQAQPIQGEISDYYLPTEVPDGGGRIHSNYSENTDACAACHYTHTALGPRLLQWSSTYQACVVCHDGTLGNYTYDVFSGKIGEIGKRTAGGLFGDNIEIANINNTTINPDTLSNHMPNGSVSLAAAYGGNPNANGDEPLQCISCHTPHGQGGNARILNPDPNKLLFKMVKEKPKEYVRWMSEIEKDIYQVPPNEYRGNWIPGYPYNNLTRVIIGSDLADFDLKLESGVLVLTGSAFFLEPEDYSIDYRAGKVTLSASGLAKKALNNWEVFAIYVPGIYVVMEIENYMDPILETVTYLAKDSQGRPTSLNVFCGACHTDYNTEECFNFNKATGQYEPHNSGKILTGTYSAATRHQVGNKWEPGILGLKETPEVLRFSQDGQEKIITCLTCHLAHGADKEYWNDTNDSYLGFPDDVVDSNPSSGLKRLPNMAVCEACHQLGDGSDGYRTLSW